MVLALRGGTRLRRVPSTPTHTSWLNQSEIWFSILSGQSLNDASFQTVEQLKTHIDSFIASYNEGARPLA